MVPHVQEFPLSDYQIRLYEVDRGTTCCSLYQKGNLDIPDDWTKCESGFTESSPFEEIMTCYWFVSQNTPFTMCFKCLLKWKEFDFKPNEDYTKFSTREEAEDETEVE